MLIDVDMMIRRGDAGQYEEAIRRRKEAELSRAQLQQKIESLKQARNSGHQTGDIPHLVCLLLPDADACIPHKEFIHRRKQRCKTRHPGVKVHPAMSSGTLRQEACALHMANLAVCFMLSHLCSSPATSFCRNG